MTPPGSPTIEALLVKLPLIGPRDSFVQVVKSLSVYERLYTPSREHMLMDN